MNTEKVMMDIYEALVQLQYPKITLINPKDVETEILSGENRICLLTWLLQQNCTKDPILVLSKLKGAGLEDELFKYFSQMGICCDKEQLLGRCSMKNQYSTLRLLLLFMKNINGSEEASNETSVNDILQRYFERDVNILPAGFTPSTKLSQAETNKYIEETTKNVNDAKESLADNNNISLKDKSEIEEMVKYIQDLKNDKCISSLENFTDAFKTLDSQAKERKDLLPQTFNMNKIIDSINVNFTKINQALNCKDEIIQSVIPTGLEATDTVLAETVDESLFWLQRVSNAQNETEEQQ